MTPPFISSMGFILFMQKNGLLQQLFPFTGRLSESFFSFWGLVLVMSLHVLPFMISILKNAMLNISSSLDEAGQIFGGNFFYRFRRILAPLPVSYTHLSTTVAAPAFVPSSSTSICVL